ncbi:MAG: hypothetical protein J6Y02_09085 [Pseudobutyrivibrio sp.]|nr:hypothetical protein [Pseudobutyrivibrio sp.]
MKTKYFESPIRGQFWVESITQNFWRLNPETGEIKSYCDLLLWRRDEYGQHEVNARMLSIGCEDIHVGDKVDVELKFKAALDRRGQIYNNVFISRLKKVEVSDI